MKETQNQPREDVVAGRNSVIELLKTGREIECIYITKTETIGSISKIIAMAKEKGIPVKDVNELKLDSLTSYANHQGVAAVTAAYEYSTVEKILESAGDEPPFIIICDEIEDVHNLGAIIRTAEASGAHGIIIPKRHGVGLTTIVAKTSVGAAEYMPVARVSNIVSTIEELKKKNIWVYAADMDGQSWCQTDYAGGVALVVGSEGSGVSRLVKEKCDFIVSLPMRGKINSLNASVAAGIVMYEITRQRLGINPKISK
ncbi:MAG: 23S rRNA (guanosine(2251)-2'-O)-methyltransferase RlmB [Oscillospiraceae bacterium]